MSNKWSVGNEVRWQVGSAFTVYRVEKIDRVAGLSTYTVIASASGADIGTTKTCTFSYLDSNHCTRVDTANPKAGDKITVGAKFTEYGKVGQYVWLITECKISIMSGENVVHAILCDGRHPSIKIGESYSWYATTLLNKSNMFTFHNEPARPMWGGVPPTVGNAEPECTCDSKVLFDEGCQCSYATWKRRQA